MLKIEQTLVLLQRGEVLINPPIGGPPVENLHQPDALELAMMSVPGTSPTSQDVRRKSAKWATAHIDHVAVADRAQRALPG